VHSPPLSVSLENEGERFAYRCRALPGSAGNVPRSPHRPYIAPTFCRGIESIVWVALDATFPPPPKLPPQCGTVVTSHRFKKRRGVGAPQSCMDRYFSLPQRLPTQAKRRCVSKLMS